MENEREGGTSSSISKRVKPPYLGDGGRWGGDRSGEDVGMGGFGSGDVIGPEGFGVGDDIVLDRRRPGEFVKQ